MYAPFIIIKQVPVSNYIGFLTLKIVESERVDSSMHIKPYEQGSKLYVLFVVTTMNPNSF